MNESRLATAVWGKIEGNLTLDAARRLFHAWEEAFSREAEKTHLILDCRTMTDYTTEARVAFTDWLSRHRNDFGRVAIVTPKPVWHMVIATMALTARLPMRAFTTLDEARDWIGPSVRIVVDET